MREPGNDLRRAAALAHVVRRTIRRIDTLRAMLPGLQQERAAAWQAVEAKRVEMQAAEALENGFRERIDAMQRGREPFAIDLFDTCRICAERAADRHQAIAGEAEGLRREHQRIEQRIANVRAEIAANEARADLCKKTRETILRQHEFALAEAEDDEVSESAGLSRARQARRLKA